MTEKGYGIMNESWNMLLTYATAMILVFVLTFHFLLESPLTGVPFESTLDFGHATGNLVDFRLFFGLLLFAAVLHGFNGVRVILLEWLHPQRRIWVLNLAVISLTAFFLALGTYTLLTVA